MTTTDNSATGMQSPFRNLKNQIRNGALPNNPRTHSIRERLEQLREANPSAQWLTLVGEDGEQQFTIGELCDRIADYCRFYETQGVRQGDTVLIILRESLDLFASFLAGIVYGALPAYFAYPSPKQSAPDFLKSIENLVQFNEIRLVIAFEEVVEVLQSGRQSIFPAGGESAATGAASDWGCYVADQVPAQSDKSLPNAPFEAFLQFSSGTTGAKKGVKISASALFNQLDAYRSAVEFDANSRVVSWLPHYHDMGLIACMLMPICESVPIVMMSPFAWVRRPAMLLEAVTKWRGTHVWLPNFALGHMTKSIADSVIGQFDLSSLQQVVCCSEPVLQETVQSFQKKFAAAGLKSDAVRACYAMAENTFAMTTTRGEPIRFVDVDRDLIQREQRIEVKTGGKSIASVGRALSNLQLRIIDEHGAPLNEDHVGEVCIQSNCMLEEYHNNPLATAEALSDGWFKTGDLGFLKDGELFITGRKKNVIIVGGENIYPQDIQSVLNAQAGLIPGRSVVFGVADQRVGTERIVVLAEAKEDRRSEDTTSIKTLIFNTLNISISTILLLPHRTLKKGTAGKISHFVNKQEYLQGGFDQFVATAERKQTPSTILDVVRSVLPDSTAKSIDCETPLMTSGVIDSFAFADLIIALEHHRGEQIPQTLWTPQNFDSVSRIEATLNRLGDDHGLEPPGRDPESLAKWRASIEARKQPTGASASKGGFWEWMINHCPIRGSWIYRFLLRQAGVQVGRNVTFLGSLHVKIRGRAANIRIADDVIIGDKVDLRNRENGRIELGPRCYLDQNVRLVAAREGGIELAFGAEVGANTVVNSGGLTRIGEFTLIASNVNINSSRHGVDSDACIKSQPHQHGAITIGDDVWIGSGASILLNTVIADGAVVSSNSVVSGEIPSMAICAGVPAKVIQFRSRAA